MDAHEKSAQNSRSKGSKRWKWFRNWISNLRADKSDTRSTNVSQSALEEAPSEGSSGKLGARELLMDNVDLIIKSLQINRHRPPAPQSESLGQGTQISARSMVFFRSAFLHDTALTSIETIRNCDSISLRARWNASIHLWSSRQQ